MLPSPPSSAKSRSRRSASYSQRSSSQSSFDVFRSSSSRLVQRSVSAKISRHPPSPPVGRREVMINEIVGNGISGILHKWVNYGRGWCPRWFVLLDGVLSYYKIDGPDRIVLNREVETGSLLIGLETFRRIDSHRDRPSRNHKPIGEIHLMVCSVRESKSDERRFSIYTGTKKRLHLRAESMEDRTAWVEALQAVKDMFPRVPNAEIMAPADSMAISTEKLRKHLKEEGLNEAAIQHSENIMRNQLMEMQKQIVALKNKHMMLIDALRHLESEKVDLENTFIYETRRQSEERGDSIRSTDEKYSEGSTSDSYDEHDRHDHSDDDHDAFFDSSEILSPSHDKNSGSDLDRSSLDSEDEETPNGEYDANLNSGTVESNYPHINRRKKLPDPVEKEKGVSLWSIIKDNVGKDLTKVCLPVYFNEPLSSLQKCFEDLEYSYLLDRAYMWGKMGNNLMRILYVAAFAVSGYACTDGRTCKPFNPLLGETYEADYPDKGIRFISEKVSHHPMVVACHCEGNGWKFWGDSTIKSKFWGRSIQLDPIGLLTLEFDDGAVFQWSKVTTSIYNLILGKVYCEHYGTMCIEGNQEYTCKIKFKEKSIINRNPYQVRGVVEDKKGGRPVATLCGKWDESLQYVIGDNSRKGKGSNMSSKSQLIWKRSEPPEHPTRYNLTQFAITLNEITPGLKEKLPPTDSRLRPDQRCLENGLYEMANNEKLRLEQRQRQARKMQQKGWSPKWFEKEKDSNTYRYIGGYWEARENGNWESCPDIFGDLPTDTDID
ncbi:oxysterol-binding protein-related protein 1B-like [Senna tora]|uniref:Oxysterol-binding protein-related protein 1B-like n=1 Tax=Senna tora TaxID=362788 RepID=A0A834X9W9_9FABA|nr:oxysterol-binding protein-related protein 1B-like [Senna tora]